MNDKSIFNNCCKDVCPDWANRPRLIHEWYRKGKTAKVIIVTEQPQGRFAWCDERKYTGTAKVIFEIAGNTKFDQGWAVNDSPCYWTHTYKCDADKAEKCTPKKCPANILQKEFDKLITEKTLVVLFGTHAKNQYVSWSKSKNGSVEKKYSYHESLRNFFCKPDKIILEPNCIFLPHPSQRSSLGQFLYLNDETKNVEGKTIIGVLAEIIETHLSKND